MTSKSDTGKPIHFEHELLPEAETLVVLKVAPHGVCHLSHDQDEDHELQLDADANGIVRFHARPSRDAKPVELTLRCADMKGKVVQHKVALRPIVRGHPVPATNLPGSPGKTIQPLGGDLMALSNAELLARGYPPRPNPTKNPTRYVRWLRRVSQSFVQVTPTKVPHPAVRFNKAPPKLFQPPRLESPTLPLPPPIVRSMFNANWNTWSGAYLTNPASQFFWIEADWTVPGVYAVNQAYSAAAEWIGLDNSATDLYQAGTDSECWYFGLFGGWTFTNYWMWIQLLPFAPWGLPNFPVSPGDAVSVDIFVADENGTTWFQDGSEGGLTPADNTVWFMIYNYTQGLSFWGTLPAGSVSEGGLTSTGFTGSTAEFIVERPSDYESGNPYPLAFFGIADMNSCWYGDALYGDRGWQLLADGSTPFDANLLYINMLDSTTNDMLTVPISFPDPNSPGGSQIMWLWLNWT